MKNIGFLIDPLDKLKPGKDSSLLLMEAGKELGFNVSFFHPNSVRAEGNTLYASIYHDGKETPSDADLNDFDFIFLREEPPVDKDYFEMACLFTTLDHPVLINHPLALQSISEKLAVHLFAEFAPTALSGRRLMDILPFLKTHKKIILKPIGHFGSAGVLKLDIADKNHEALILEVTQNETCLVHCQKFLDSVTQGDKRVFIIHSQPHGAFYSMPKEGDFRGSSTFGATFKPAEISPREKEASLAIGDYLLNVGVYFAGLDFVGEQLTEVNVTCPGGIWNMNHVYGIRYEIDCLKALLAPWIPRLDKM